jgi:L-alanine-DL-glutamate epimerase-like enolase superfamily enzyme
MDDQMNRSLTVETGDWPLKTPLRIANGFFPTSEVVTVSITQDGAVGRGEAEGVYYLNDTADVIRGQIQSVRREIEQGADRSSLAKLLPQGGARNALDCALWDLEAQISGKPAWQAAGLEEPRRLQTTWTIGADSPEAMAALAAGMEGWEFIKLKLVGDGEDRQRVEAVRNARPAAWIGVDANQGFDRPMLEALMPAFVAARVKLIEQPFPVGEEHQLDGLDSPIPIAADESAQSSADLEPLVGRFDVVNIKLDKCGGLTEGLEMARAARAQGLQVMVGNMTGTSLAMAPAFLVGQLCDLVDLDGPLLLTHDRDPPMIYEAGMIDSPHRLWGYPR